MYNNTRSSREESDESSFEEATPFAHQKSIATTKKSVKSSKNKNNQIDILDKILSKPGEERDKQERDKLLGMLKNVPFLANVQEPLLILLSEKVEPITFGEGEIIINKGDEANCMYIIYFGSAGVFSDVECTKQLFTCVPNGIFGEKALENDNKRGASIKALTFCKLIRIKKQSYKSIIQVSTHFLLHICSLSIHHHV